MATKPPFTMKPLFLVSNSPRRASLLKQLGLQFEIQMPKSKEAVIQTGTDKDIVKTVRENALQKALSILPMIQQGLLISGDTLIVTEGNQILGKPKTSEEAFQMLMSLVGTTHRVISAVAVVDAMTTKSKVNHLWTQISFRKASFEELHCYIATKEPLRKAGGYAIQGKGGFLVEQIKGSYTAAMGLPVEILIPLLKQFGVSPTHYW